VASIAAATPTPTPSPAPADGGTGDATAVADLPPLHEAAPAQAAGLPPLEPVPGNDSAVRQAGASGLDRVLQEGRKERERAVSQALDVDDAAKASTLRELADKDKQRIKGAVTDAMARGKKVGGQVQGRVGQVQDRISKGRQGIEQSVADSIAKSQQQV